MAWGKRGIASYTGVSSGGVVNFQLALPKTAWDERARFVVTHPADDTYQAVNSLGAHFKVTKPTPTPPSPCVRAKRRARSLALLRQRRGECLHEKGPPRRAFP